MKTARFLSATIWVYLSIAISNSCSQPVNTTNSPVYGVYEATTPCDESVNKMLRLSPDTKCEMIKWKLTLYREANMDNPSSFNLICMYGLPKQGTRGFQEGVKTIELNGKCTTGQGISGHKNAIVYNLVADSSAISISFFQPDQNLLHLLTDDKNLVVGTGAWSYTLNRKEPVSTSAEKFIPKPVSNIKLATDSAIIGIFEGRSPCYSAIKELHGITATACNLVKYQLTLFQDSITHTPTTFLLYTVYVGFGDNNRYSITGKWNVFQGTIADPAAVVYQLEPRKSQIHLLFQKADDNILFFLDNDTRLLSGNDYSSYTLNRKRK